MNVVDSCASIAPRRLNRFAFPPVRLWWSAMSRFTDTIAALATPLGTSAIALLRVSGVDTARVVAELFGETPPPRSVRRADYHDAQGCVLDDVLFTFFKAPQSYTGEDSLEITCHGNPLIAQKILEDLLARGCRAAEAGEFTQRAFLNGQMDLSQAEAVMDLIHARSERALTAANQQLRGALGRRMATVMNRLLGVLARVEAYIDFPEEDLPDEDRNWVGDQLDELESELSKLLATNHYGRILREGLKTVIVGRPNAGKSSLLNRMVGYDRALVSAEPGTTRDYLEEPIMVGAHLVRLTDTAGLNRTPATLEGLGIAKTWERIEDADLVLVVVDGSVETALDVDIKELAISHAVITVINKCDLPSPSASFSCGSEIPVVRVSALQGVGMERLFDEISRAADRFQSEVGEEQIAINARHASALTEAQAGLAAARQKLGAGEASELVASDLRGVLSACGELAGRADNEQMLDQLFATFCIGK